MIPLSTILSMSYYVTTGCVPSRHHNSLSLHPHTEIILISLVCVLRRGDINILTCAVANAVSNIIIYNIIIYLRTIVLYYYSITCVEWLWRGRTWYEFANAHSWPSSDVHPSTGHSTAIAFNDAEADVLVLLAIS